MISALFQTGRPRTFVGREKKFALAGGALVAAGVIYSNIALVADRTLVGILFVSAIFALMFVCVGAKPESSDKPSKIDWLLSAGSVAVGIYFFITRDDITERISLLTPFTTWQVVFGSALLFLTLEATRRSTGWGLTIIVLAFLGYNLFGDVLPPPWGHGEIDYLHLLDILIFTGDGVFGVPIQVVSSYVFMFVMFGSLLSKLGGGEFFYQLAAAATGKQVGGPAKIAVISSGLYGTISGSPTSDVVTTGTITIPMMKRLGYSARFAAAVEVAASTGGSAMPPIMGSAAFILAEYTGIPLSSVLIAALVPALIYYTGVFSQVHLRAFHGNLKGGAGDTLKVRDVLRQDWALLLPIAVLSGTLIVGYSPIMVAMIGTTTLIATCLLFRRKQTSLFDIFKAISETTFTIMVVTGACAAAGLVIGGLSMTGLALKGANIITMVGGGAPFLMLIVAALVTILLGLGMPTPSAYILAAVISGPALVHAGLPLLGSHMFLLFYAILSALTPPVAVAAYAASAIAKEDPIKIAVTAMGLAWVGFLVPFAFIWNPAILAQGASQDILLAFAGGICGAIWVAFFFEAVGGLWGKSTIRVISMLAAPACVAPYWYISAPAIVISLLCFQFMKTKKMW